MTDKEKRFLDYMGDPNIGELLMNFLDNVEKHTGKKIDGKVQMDVTFVFCEDCLQQSFVLTLKQFDKKLDLKRASICPCCGKKQEILTNEEWEKRHEDKT